MNYKKTIRLFEPFGGWGSHGGFYNKYLKKDDYPPVDTGLCNRLLNWEAIYYILQEAKDEQLHIAVQKHIWPELALIELPDTVEVGYNIWRNDWYGKHEHGDLYFKAIFHDDAETITLSEKLDKNKVLELYKTKDFKEILKNDHWYTDTGFITLKSILETVNETGINSKNNKFFPKPRPLGKIELRDRRIQDKIEIKYSSYVGIHIRRGNGVYLTDEIIKKYSDEINSEDFLKYKENFIVNTNKNYRFVFDTEYFEIIDKILEINPEQKFYISHDLPDEFLENFYKRYPNKIISKKDIRKEYYNYYKKTIPNLDQLINYANILDNTLDLFILSSCGFKVLSGASTWSNFADYYERQYSPPKAKKNYLVDDMKDLINDSEKLKEILSNIPKPELDKLL